MSKQICKFYVEGKCSHGHNCNFTHIDNLCKDWFFSKCDYGSKCKFIHPDSNLFNSSINSKKLKSRPKKLIAVNTETFEPWYDVPDMQIVIATSQTQISESDIFLNTDLFDQSDTKIYYKLLDEIENSGTNINELWKPWHGDTHLIADDHLNWKKSCPTFNMIIDKITKYFNMDVKATRFNLYENLLDYKPMHFDAAAIDPKKAQTQNVTIGVSFGYTRNIEFSHAKTKTRVSIPLPNGMIYGFGKQVNLDWRHGIPPIKPEVITEENKTNKNLGRISIILWGKTDQVKL
jgi:hypothetical protein